MQNWLHVGSISVSIFPSLGLFPFEGRQFLQFFTALTFQFGKGREMRDGFLLLFPAGTCGGWRQEKILGGQEGSASPHLPALSNPYWPLASALQGNTCPLTGTIFLSAGVTQTRAVVVMNNRYKREAFAPLHFLLWVNGNTPNPASLNCSGKTGAHRKRGWFLPLCGLEPPKWLFLWHQLLHHQQSESKRKK